MTFPAGLFRYPVSAAEALGLYEPENQPKSREDQAADLDYRDRALEGYVSDATDPSAVPTFNQSLDRGRDAITFVSSTTFSGTGTFGAGFNSSPVVILTVECGRGQDIRPILTVVSSSGFNYKLTNAASSTTTAYVHWVAVKRT